MDQKILSQIKEKISKKRPIYMSFIDSTVYSIDEIIKISKKINNSYADMIVVGGILTVDMNYMNQVVKKIKENTNLPVLILPGNAGMVSKYADAILFNSLLNSRNPYWITGAQALSAPLIYYSKVEVIPTSYIVIEPGGTSSWIGDANPIPRNK
ncbi:MAG: geranylgeranylglyceryl/heptaprenylglyceryl phosphate synthase, partial [Candidatus Aenigmarchaeota archaeon]|nr:geranylgeranylglyceryl/heptaprenylglyceryl phosphate synthase [Candidatus Aenigmarchaeota archaeon]